MSEPVSDILPCPFCGARAEKKPVADGKGRRMSKRQTRKQWIKDSAEAVIEDRCIVIRVPVEVLPTVVDGGWMLGIFDVRKRVTNVAVFAKELVRALNDEDERGTTRVHRCFDDAINFAIEQGYEGLEDNPDQSEGAKP